VVVNPCIEAMISGDEMDKVVLKNGIIIMTTSTT
jgi:hypothetical protein